MAKPKMREGGYGHIPLPGTLTREQDGTVSDATLSRIHRQLEIITAALNGGLRLKAGQNLGRAGNFNAQLLEFTTPSTPDTEFSQPHSLGVAPDGYFVVLQNKAGSLYTSNYGGWDQQTVYFKSDTADMLMNIIVFA